MRRILVIALLFAATFSTGCLLYYVDHDLSVTAGSTIEIDAVITGQSGPAGAQTPIACIGIPTSWGTVQSVIYEAYIAGSSLTTGSGTPSAAETAQMNSGYAFTTGGESALWQCFEGTSLDYGDDPYGTATFRVPVGSAGIYTLRYSFGTVEYGPDYSMASKSLGVDETIGDLSRWEAVDLEPDTDLSIYRVVYGGGTFAAAGYRSGSVSLSSGNGKDWALTSLPLTGDISGMTYGDGQFLLLNDDGVAIRSTDGSSWIDSASIGFGTNAVAYGAGLFVAVGENGLAAVSSDGAVWSTAQASPASTDEFMGITYGNGRFSAVGYNSVNAISYGSTNGTNWTGTPLTSVDDILFDVAYGNSRFVAVGTLGRIMHSDNGYGSWVDVSMAMDENLVSVIYGNGIFIATSDKGTILTSPDGETWQDRGSGTGAYLSDVAAGEGGFVVVGEDGLVLWQGLDSGGGGGGGGCNTTGKAAGDPVWPDMIWILLLTVAAVWRRRFKTVS